MFAKVFGQIFDSSIAEDYNCRRMFMDLLVLADPTGAVDMTPEAIARRTNVPIEEVRKYLTELSSPDPASRSQVEQGRRLMPLDSNRDWGWQIVNYQHYRKLKDQDALRSYFRDAQRKHRAKKRGVKDNGLTGFNGNGHSLTPPSSSTSASFWEELKGNPLYKGIDIPREFEKAKQWCKRKRRNLTRRFFEGWLEKADRALIELQPSKPKYLPPINNVSEEELEAQRKIVRVASEKLKAEFNR